MEVELNRCSRTNGSISHDGTYRQAGGRPNQLVEELVEIYATPTPKGWRGAKKESNLYWLIGCPFYNSQGPIFIPEA